MKVRRSGLGRLALGSAAALLAVASAPETASADGERYVQRSYKDPVADYSAILTKPYIFYVGGAVGEYWLNSEHTHHAINSWNAFPASQQFLNKTGSDKISGSEMTLSAFLGLETRVGNVMLGIEADANYLGFQRRTEIAPGPVFIPGVGPAVADFFNSVRIAHLETLRLRLGYTMGHTTLFMTGGLAAGEVDFVQSINFPYSSASYANGRQMKYGWVIGGGFEHQLSRDVSLRAEYLYADLGRLTKNYTNACSSGANNPPSCGLNYAPGFDHRVDYDVTTHIARVGLKVAMHEFGGGGGESYKAGAVPGSYVDYASMKTDFSGLYISPIAGFVTGKTTFALGRFNTGYNPSTNGPLFSNPFGNGEVHKVDLNGGSFGGVLGYQKQFNSLVVGADVSLSASMGTDGKSDCSPANGNSGGNFNVTALCSSRLDYTTAFRLRTGYASDKWLFYVNGGPAFAKIDNDVSYGGQVTKFADASAGGTQRINASNFNETGSAFTKGWTYGVGVEWEWKPGMSFGLSYNHTYLQDVIVDLRRADGSTNSRRLVSVDPDVIGSSLKIKLGDTAQAPVQAPPAPATQQVAAAAAPPPAPAPAAAPAAQRPRPAAARPSVQRPAAAPAPAATPAAATPVPAVRVTPAPAAAPAAAAPAPARPAPKPAVPVDGTPAEPAPQMGKPQK